MKKFLVYKCKFFSQNKIEKDVVYLTVTIKYEN